jgi:ParB-like chromosome segregation protein Spo0J
MKANDRVRSQISKLASAGLTDEQIALALDVPCRTVGRYVVEARRGPPDPRALDHAPEPFDAEDPSLVERLREEVRRPGRGASAERHATDEDRWATIDLRVDEILIADANADDVAHRVGDAAAVSTVASSVVGDRLAQLGVVADWIPADDLATLTVGQRTVWLAPTVQIRSRCDEDTVRRYMASYRELPPVDVMRIGTQRPARADPGGRLADTRDDDERAEIVDQMWASEGSGTSRYVLVDGFHRLEAARRLGLETTRARVRDGTWRDALVHAVVANCRHGQPLTRAERDEGIFRLRRLHPEWPLRKIGAEMGLAHMTVKYILDISELREAVGAEAVHMCTVIRSREVARAPREWWTELVDVVCAHDWSVDEIRAAVPTLRDPGVSWEEKVELVSPEAPRRQESQPREGREPEPLLARLQKVMERVDDFRSRPPDEFVEGCEDPVALRWVVDNYPTCIALFARILARAAIKLQATDGTPEAFARGLGDAERAGIVETFPSCIEFLQSVVDELQRPRPSTDGRAPRPTATPGANGRHRAQGAAGPHERGRRSGSAASARPQRRP